MKHTASIVVATLCAAVVLTASAADAKVYSFHYASTDGSLQAAGQITADASGEATGVSGEISGLVNDAITGLVANPAFSGSAYSPDGAFIYDDAFFAGSGQFVDWYGLLFTTASGGGYWNLWGNAPGSYSLWESAPGYGYPVSTSGTLSIAGAPEPSTWLMMGLGFAGLFAAGASRRGKPRLAVAE